MNVCEVLRKGLPVTFSKNIDNKDVVFMSMVGVIPN